MNKSRSKNEAKRQQILKSATTLFTEKGYATTSMALIAKEADVSKQTVYSHFGSKEDLFSASISQKCDSSMLFEMNALNLNDPYSTLLEIGKRFFSMVTSKEALAVHKICAFESKTYPKLSELFFQAAVERLTNEITKMMNHFDQQSLLDIPEPRYAAIQFLHMVKGEAWMRIEFNTLHQLSEQEVHEYIVNCVEFFLRGYSVQRP